MQFVPRGFALANTTRWLLAVAPDGTFAARSNGTAIFASSRERLIQLVADKAAGTTTKLPDGFAGWVSVDEEPAAKPQDGFRPFPQQAARAAASKQEESASDLPRTPGETAATLALCLSNAERCLRGDIGGNLVQYSKSVDTALANYRESVAFWTTSPTRYAGCAVSEALVNRYEAFKASMAASA